jgi:hypothetical protein
MADLSDEILIQRLQVHGERVTWAISSTVYLMKGSRFIAWMKPVRGLGVSPLPDDYGFDHYEAAENFLREVREQGMW